MYDYTVRRMTIEWAVLRHKWMNNLGVRLALAARVFVFCVHEKEGTMPPPRFTTTYATHDDYAFTIANLTLFLSLNFHF
jgi:hypothetical protein